MKFAQEQQIQGINDYKQLQCDDTKTKDAALSVITEIDSPKFGLMTRLLIIYQNKIPTACQKKIIHKNCFL